jgi:peptidoglycan/xylan/chitin deacetylase (PgdA/CDA1 family)
MGRKGYSPTGGLHFDDEEFESRIVWIWTMARSGSTWLLRMLSHPLKLVDSSKDPEDMLGFVAPRTWQGTVDAIPVDTTFVSNHLLPLAGPTDYSDDLVPLTFSSALGLRGRGNYFFSPKYDDAWRPELRRMMLVRFHRLVERTAERYDVESPLVLLKEVAGAHAAPLVMSMFPRSRLVFLVRDGRDVVDSQTAANQPGGWLPVGGWTTPEERREFIRRRARTWVGDVASIERAFEAHPPELRKMVRYEDLLAAPAATLRPLVEWLGLRRSERWLERAVEANAFDSVASEHKGPKKFYRSATPGAWRKNMTDEETATLESVMGDKLREVGYPMTAPDNETSGAETDSGAPGLGVPGKGGGVDVVSAAIRKQGEGRDFSDVPRLVQKRGSAASRRDRMVALTFDDGPVLQTHRALETLERHGARGTFFLVGRKLDGHQALIQRILSGGHEIGNHSFTHSPFPQRDDLAACSALIEHLTGARPRLFRPPFGAVDRPGAEAAMQDGMRVILWGVDSKDAVPPWKGISAEEITRRVLDHVSPGSVVLLHDGLPWSQAIDALPDLIERLHGEGYRLVTVSELLADRDPRRPRPTRRVLRRLRRRLNAGGGSLEAVPPPTDDPDANASAPGVADTEVGDRKRLVELLEKVAGGVDAPSDEAEAGPAGRLIRGACIGVADGRTASDLLARHAAAYEVNAVRVIALGFSLRRFESDQGSAAPLTERFAVRLHHAGDPGAEAKLVAQELGGRIGMERLIAARLAQREAEDSDLATEGRTFKLGGRAEPDPDSASPEFLSIFGPGPKVWEQLESWAREIGRGVARRRLRALLDAAGVDGGFDIERVVGQLHIGFLFRFGYVLAACEEELSQAGS